MIWKFKLSVFIFVFGFWIAGCAEQSALTPESDDSKALIIQDPTSTSLLSGTEIGNPVDETIYALSVLINDAEPQSNEVQLVSSDRISCSQIDISEFQGQIDDGTLLVSYFVMARREDGFRRNYMGQIRAGALIATFGVGSNIKFQCQVIVYNHSYQTLLSEKSELLSCNNCGAQAEGQ